MRRVIRNGTFETNSSAVHSLVISPDGLEPSNLPMDADGCITINFGNFGEYDEGITTFDQEMKLRYIATECFYLNNWDTYIEDFYPWKCVCDAVCKYSGAKGIRLGSAIEPELNHQVQPEYGELKFCSYWNEDSIINFIFNEYAGIKMSHD